MFKSWLLNEETGSVLFAKAVDQQGLESILKSGFKAQGRQSQAASGFSKGMGSTEEQMYGPGLYFYLVGSEEHAKRTCKDYAGWGGQVVLASLSSSAKLLITSWLPESHPIWHYSPAGHAGVYDQLKALGVLDLFPGYNQSNTHVDPEWGYKLSGRIDGWIHQHNSRTHLVVYKPDVLRVSGHFECGGAKETQPQSFSGNVSSPSKINPKTGKEYDPSVPLDKQMKLTGLLLNMKDLNAVRLIQRDRSHPDYAFWVRFKIDSEPAKPKANELSLEDI